MKREKNKTLLLLVEQDGFGQTCEDLWNMHRNDLPDHLRKADLGVKRLSLNKQVKGKLMELLYGLKERKARNWLCHVNEIY